jgi:uncharacterized protein (DUF849 family)
MIVQACLNGARPADFHPQIPLSAEAIARDGAACVSAGAAELHVHPRGEDRHESLNSVDRTVLELRRTCPGTLIGVSTGAWIENDVERTRAAIAHWRELPDYASVNLSEPDAPAVMELLRGRHVGIEAGLASVADAERLVRLGGHDHVFRVLIEIDEQDPGNALRIADEVASVLDRANVRRQNLLHGFDATVWQFVAEARRRRYATRVGLEDGKALPDGKEAADNAAVVAAAVAIYRGPETAR